MNAIDSAVWVCALIVAYPYAIYPAAIGAAARLLARPPMRGPFRGTVSIVVVARNEAAVIGKRLDELCDRFAESGVQGEVIAVSDGSTDGTAQIVRTRARVRLLELPIGIGKAAALSRGAAAATGDVLVFADARQTWTRDTLPRLLENFADDRVGAASGDLELPPGAGVLDGVAVYWRFEKWLRRQESAVSSVIGVTGAVCAVRRPLFSPLPAGTILDDVAWPLAVLMRGYRVVHDPSAVSIDRFPGDAAHEFRRKLRTLCGNLQLLQVMPSAFTWRNPAAFQFWSHKMCRLAVPWALVALIALPVFASSRAFSLTLLAGEAAAYAAAIVGLLHPAAPRVARAAAAFVVMNAAAGLALWLWASGRSGNVWNRSGRWTPEQAP